MPTFIDGDESNAKDTMSESTDPSPALGSFPELDRQEDTAASDPPEQDHDGDNSSSDGNGDDGKSGIVAEETKAIHSETAQTKAPPKRPKPRRAPQRRCRVEGCKNKVRQGGVCIRHGAPGAKKTAERTCQVEGCGKWRQGRGGRWCYRHMPPGEKARYRCSEEGCTNYGRRGGKCILHSTATSGREGKRAPSQDAHAVGCATTTTSNEDDEGDRVDDTDTCVVIEKQKPDGRIGIDRDNANVDLDLYPKDKMDRCTEIMENKPGSNPQTKEKAPPNIMGRLCNFPGCTKWRQRHSGAFCWAHGRNLVKMLCRVDGCDNVAPNRGVCAKHGARKLPGAQRRARSKEGRKDRAPRAVPRGLRAKRGGGERQPRRPKAIPLGEEVAKKIGALQEKEQQEAPSEEPSDEAAALERSDEGGDVGDAGDRMNPLLAAKNSVVVRFKSALSAEKETDGSIGTDERDDAAADPELFQEGEMDRCIEAREERPHKNKRAREEEAAVLETDGKDGKDEEEGEVREEDRVDEMDACIVIRKKKTDSSVGSNECENNEKTDVVDQKMIMGIDPLLAAKNPVLQQQRLGKMQAIAGKKRPAATTVTPSTCQRPQKQRRQEEPSGHRFQQQLQDLRRMGFIDRLANIRALAMSRGDFVEAIQILLPEDEDETSSALEEGTGDEVGDGYATQLQPRHPGRLKNLQVRQEMRMLQQDQSHSQGDRGKNLDVHDEHRTQQLPLSVAQGEPNLGNVTSLTSIVDMTGVNKDKMSSLQRLEEQATQIEASCRLLAPHLRSPSDCTPQLIHRCGSLEEELRRVRLRIALLRSQEILVGDNHDDAMLTSQRKSAGDNNDDAQLERPKDDGPPCKVKENLFLCTTEEEILLYLEATKKQRRGRGSPLP